MEKLCKLDLPWSGHTGTEEMVAAQLGVEGGIFEQELRGEREVGSFSLILNQFDGANTMHVMLSMQIRQL